MSNSQAYIFELVRQHDRDRFVTAMFAPATARDALIALYALNVELARIPATVSEPMLGQMRIQWWRDLLGRMFDGGAPPEGHPVSQTLTSVLPLLDRAAVMTFIDAHEAAFTAEDATAGEAPVGRALARIALGLLKAADDATIAAANDAAIALTLANELRRSPSADVAAHARQHIVGARAEQARVDRRGLPVLLWCTAAEARLRNPNGPPPVIRLWWNALRGKY